MKVTASKSDRKMGVTLWGKNQVSYALQFPGI